MIRFALPPSVDAADASMFTELLGVPVRVDAGVVEAGIEHPTAAVHRLTGWAIEAGVELDSLSITRVSLENVYLALTANVPDAQAGSDTAGGTA